LQATLVENVSDAISNGMFRSTLNAKDAAMLIWGIVQSLVLRMLVNRNPELLLRDGERLLDLQLTGFILAEKSS
jgi:hypothetical protein